MKIGDVVRLKSGGPLMTIEEAERLENYCTITCVWFKKHKVCSAEFTEEMLYVQSSETNPVNADVSRST